MKIQICLIMLIIRNFFLRGSVWENQVVSESSMAQFFKTFRKIAQIVKTQTCCQKWWSVRANFMKVLKNWAILLSLTIPGFLIHCLLKRNSSWSTWSNTIKQDLFESSKIIYFFDIRILTFAPALQILKNLHYQNSNIKIRIWISKYGYVTLSILWIRLIPHTSSNEQTCSRQCLAEHVLFGPGNVWFAVFGWKLDGIQ